MGPSHSFLAYVEDVLPRLGEDGVQACTLRDLVPEGAAASPEHNELVARLKSSARLVDAVDKAVDLRERPPTSTVVVETAWADVPIELADWVEAFAAADDGTPHNEAREHVWDALIDVLTDKLGERGDEQDDLDDFDAYGRERQFMGASVRRALESDPDLHAEFDRAWPLITATSIVSDLWSRPDILRSCAPWLAPDELDALYRVSTTTWTVEDLPFLDAARRRVGDPQLAQRQRRQQAALATERARMSEVVDRLIETDDTELGIMSMLRGQDLRSALVDEGVVPAFDRDALHGPFAHIVVDEAQELSDAEWQMLRGRCPSGSFTIVGDRAQARRGFRESWEQRLSRVGIGRVRVAPLTINYRTPEEVMSVAEPVIRAALPDANVPSSVRRTGIPVTYGSPHEVSSIVDAWIQEHQDGVVCVIGDPSFPSSGRVYSMVPEQSKGLEFDLVILVNPDQYGDDTTAVVDRYVAMTRATQRLVILQS